MGLYIKDEDIRVRLLGKVKFTDDEDDENRMHVSLLRRLIEEAEGEVEFDLSPRYATPFTTWEGLRFDKLLTRPADRRTSNVLRTLCELMACVRVLETDFGRGSNVNGEAYAERLRARYNDLIEKIMARKEDGSGTGWKYPPLPGLKLAYHNSAADDGFQGMVIVTSNSTTDDYPSQTINDPGANWLTGLIPEAYD